MPSAGRLPLKNAAPRLCDGVSELSRLRTGLGGSCTCSWKSVKACICAGVGMLTVPTRLWNATMKLLNDRFSSVALTEEPVGPVAAPVHRP
jgi:hypothetical protein